MEIIITLVLVAVVAYFIINKKDSKKVEVASTQPETVVAESVPVPATTITTDEPSDQTSANVVIAESPDQEPSAYTPPADQPVFGDGAEGNGEVKEVAPVKKSRAKKEKVTEDVIAEPKSKAKKPKITVAK